MSDIREVLGSGYPDSKFTTRFSLEHEMTSDAFQALLKLRKLALHFHTTIFGKFLLFSCITSKLSYSKSFVQLL